MEETSGTRDHEMTDDKIRAVSRRKSHAQGYLSNTKTNMKRKTQGRTVLMLQSCMMMTGKVIINGERWLTLELLTFKKEEADKMMRIWKVR